MHDDLAVCAESASSWYRANFLKGNLDKYQTMALGSSQFDVSSDSVNGVKQCDCWGAVYKIKCCDCQASYIGETGRNLSTRLTEHKRATRNGDVNNHIAEHHLKTKHQIDWDSATCITVIFYRLLSTSYFRKLVY